MLSWPQESILSTLVEKILQYLHLGSEEKGSEWLNEWPKVTQTRRWLSWGLNACDFMRLHFREYRPGAEGCSVRCRHWMFMLWEKMEKVGTETRNQMPLRGGWDSHGVSTAWQCDWSLSSPLDVLVSLIGMFVCGNGSVWVHLFYVLWFGIRILIYFLFTKASVNNEQSLMLEILETTQRSWICFFSLHLFDLDISAGRSQVLVSHAYNPAFERLRQEDCCRFQVRPAGDMYSGLVFTLTLTWSPQK